MGVLLLSCALFTGTGKPSATADIAEDQAPATNECVDPGPAPASTAVVHRDLKPENVILTVVTPAPEELLTVPLEGAIFTEALESPRAAPILPDRGRSRGLALILRSYSTATAPGHWSRGLMGSERWAWANSRA